MCVAVLCKHFEGSRVFFGKNRGLFFGKVWVVFGKEQGALW